MSSSLHPLNRYIALQVYEHYLVIGAVDEQQRLVWSQRSLPLANLQDWLSTRFRPTDTVVLEAGANSWYISDLLQPLVASVIVVPPCVVKRGGSMYTRTNQGETIDLARWYAASLVSFIG